MAARALNAISSPLSSSMLHKAAVAELGSSRAKNFSSQHSAVNFLSVRSRATSGGRPWDTRAKTCISSVVGRAARAGEVVTSEAVPKEISSEELKLIPDSYFLTDTRPVILFDGTGSGTCLNVASGTGTGTFHEEQSIVDLLETDVQAIRRTVFGEEASWNRRILVAVPGLVGLNLSGPQSVLEALGVLAAIITVHEAGHFLAARLQNIHVTKFAVGFGPALAKYQKQGVEYSLRAFPFGGFVAFPDDDPNSEFSPDDPNLLKNRPLLDRALVISAGVIANIIFAYSVLFVQTLGVGLLERELFPGVMVPEVINKSAAAKAGMQVGDVVLAVDGYQLSAQDSAVFELVDTIKRSPGKPLTLLVQHGENVMGVKVTPDENRDGSGRIGVQLSPNSKAHRVKVENLVDAAVKSGREFGRLTATVVEGLKQILFNFEKTVDSVSGPVAIVAVGAEVARSDITGLYQFAAIVNINLAIVNLLPLPALDGGYLAFVILEAVRGGKKLPDGVEQGIMSSGVLLLLALGIVLMVRDTLNLGFVQQML